MTKLQVNRLQELATALTKSEQLSNNAQYDIKGGCSSCEDGRRPPKANGNWWGNWGGNNQN
jgi:hypothetical protein